MEAVHDFLVDGDLSVLSALAVHQQVILAIAIKADVATIQTYHL